VAPIFEILRQNTAGIDACRIYDYGLGARAAETEITYYPGATAMSGLYADPARDRGVVEAALRRFGLAPEERGDELARRFEPQRLRCQLRPLSAFLAVQPLDRIDLLKIDVEGAELDVLAGIEAADWPKITQVAIEVHESHGHREPVRRLLESHGFELSWERPTAMEKSEVGMVYGRRR
jgi:FkbM family methyltransferase